MKNFTFKINENSYSAKIISHENNTIELEVNGTSYSVKLKEEITKPKTPTLVRKPVQTNTTGPVVAKPGTPGKTKIVAPIPGVVLDIHVKVGDTIKENDSLILLEAMKMENDITSEYSGVISAINISKGQQVLQGEVMIELEQK